MNNHHKSCLLLLLLVTLFSCEKHRAKELSGTYNCSVHYEYWDMTPKVIDTVYSENLEIKRDGENLFVLGEMIHVSKLKNGKLYRKSTTHTNFEVSILKDVLYVSTTGGGLGGESTRTYKGKKIH